MAPHEEPGDEGAGGKAKARAFIALGIFLLILVLTYVLRPDDFISYVKAFHVVAVMSWMAGLLYLPRLFIYHTDAPIGSDRSETFKMMERRLLKVIMNPAMMVSWVLGLYLAWDVYGFQGGWLHGKIAMVVALTGVHVLFGRAVRDFAADKPRRKASHWRIWNEVPTVLMIAIVILVIVKPF